MYVPLQKTAGHYLLWEKNRCWKCGGTHGWYTNGGGDGTGICVCGRYKAEMKILPEAARHRRGIRQ